MIHTLDQEEAVRKIGDENFPDAFPFVDYSCFDLIERGRLPEELSIKGELEFHAGSCHSIIIYVESFSLFKMMRLCSGELFIFWLLTEAT